MSDPISSTTAGARPRDVGGANGRAVDGVSVADAHLRPGASLRRRRGALAAKHESE